MPTVVPLGEDRKDDLLDVDQWAFAADTNDVADTMLLGFEWDRTAGAELGGELAGVHSVYSLHLPVPGGEVPAAGLTWVGVHPQYRRRGVLTAMMRRHLDGVRERGDEPVSALWAAEPAIYGRFGYGQASFELRMTLQRGVALHDVTGWQDLRVTLRRVDPDRDLGVVQRVFDAVRDGRPGMMSRRGGLARRSLEDPKPWRDGAESLRLLLVSTADGEPRGYALFRRKEKWEDAGPRGEVLVRETRAVDAAAARALWGRLTDLDLMAVVRTGSLPADDPLLHLLADPRAALPRLCDGIWVRVVDLPAALAARRYGREVDVVLAVDDPLCPWNTGRWRLWGGRDGASCQATSVDADLVVDVRALGSALLGGQTLAALAGAGRVEEVTPGALAAASAAFAWPVAPWCGWVF